MVEENFEDDFDFAKDEPHRKAAENNNMVSSSSTATRDGGKGGGEAADTKAGACQPSRAGGESRLDKETDASICSSAATNPTSSVHRFGRCKSSSFDSVAGDARELHLLITQVDIVNLQFDLEL